MLRWRLAQMLAFAGASACASAGDPADTGLRAAFVHRHDDGRAQRPITFPGSNFEALVRFKVAGGPVRRIWWRPAGAGQLRIFLYGNSALDGPGEVLYEAERSIRPEQVSRGDDDRWVYEAVQGVKLPSGTVWVGFRPGGGTPSLWASDGNAGTYFVRKHQAGGASGLFPVRRTPLLRLELAPDAETARTGATDDGG